MLLYYGKKRTLSSAGGKLNDSRFMNSERNGQAAKLRKNTTVFFKTLFMRLVIWKQHRYPLMVKVTKQNTHSHHMAILYMWV